MTIVSLWLPVVISAVIVFVASALVWMVLPWHKSDYRPTVDEDRVREALRGLAVGQYVVPFCADPAALKDEAMRTRYLEGPQAFITVAPNRLPRMLPKLLAAFAYYVVVGVACAYMVSRTLPASADYLQVFRVAGTVAFLAYGIAYIQDSIWFSRPWSLTCKNLVDALIYGLLTGGIFGWLT
jgi:hypothetical protein